MGSKPELKLSKKYKAVDQSTRLFFEENFKEKAANLLHQSWGAFYSTRPNFIKLLKKFQKDNNKQEFIDKLLLIHSSTKERIEVYSEFYKRIFEITGTPNSIADHGCGLNPLSLKFINLSNLKYFAFDIDLEEINFLNQIVPQVFPSIEFTAEYEDLNINPQFRNVDLDFYLKIFPVLDKIDKNATKNILKNSKAKFIIISFPLKSISGNEKGMYKFYKENFEKLASEINFPYNEVLFENEAIFIIKNEK